MNVNGKAIAADILRATKEKVGALGREPIVRAIVMRPTAATRSYLRIKTEMAHEAGMRFELVCMEDDATTEDLIEKIRLPGADAVIVQLPLPPSVDERRILDAIPPAQDADVLSHAAYERFLAGEADALLPPVVAAVAELIERHDIEVAGKKAVIVGSGRLVGQPVRAWLIKQHAEVLVLTQESFEERKGALKNGRVVVSGAGSPHLIKPEMLRDAAVLIDAGTSESDGAIVGDFDPACAKKAALFTPVPGGVGPIAVACLFKNAANLITRTLEA